MNADEIHNKTGIKLIPCPFCGTSIENLLVYGTDSDYGYVSCLHCDAHGPEISLSKLDKGQNYLTALVEGWNKRHGVVDSDFDIEWDNR